MSMALTKVVKQEFLEGFAALVDDAITDVTDKIGQL